MKYPPKKNVKIALMMDDNNNNRLHQQIYTRLNTSKTNWLSIQRHIYVIQKMDLRYYTTTTTKSLATFCFLSFTKY